MDNLSTNLRQLHNPASRGSGRARTSSPPFCLFGARRSIDSLSRKKYIGNREVAMNRMTRSLLFALLFISVGFVLARIDAAAPVAFAQTPPAPSTPGPVAPSDKVGGAARSAAREAAATVAPDVKLLLEQVNRKVEAVERSLDKLAGEARARVVTYALWAAGGLFVLTFVSALLGGVVAGLMLRHSRRRLIQ